jgi:hypothetical protein
MLMAGALVEKLFATLAGEAKKRIIPAAFPVGYLINRGSGEEEH